MKITGFSPRHGLALLAALLLLASRMALIAQTVSYSGTAVNFGSVNICPAGQTTPAPCSETLTLNFTVTASGTLGPIQVLTLGAPDLDFTLASGSTCTGSVIQGNSCKVNVKFAPRFAGLRRGGVEIFDGSDELLADVLVYGIGSGPQITFQPGTQSTLGSGLGCATGAAVDGSGNLFVADNCTKAVYEILAAGGFTTTKTLASPFSGISFGPFGLAVDGSGNVFVADSGNSAVYEILAAGGYTTVKILTSNIIINAYDVAVDGSGNVFVADNGVTEILAAGGYTTVKTLGGGFTVAYGVAVDGSGNVFVADVAGNSVKEILAAGGYTTVNTLGSGFYNPIGVAVDAAGNVFVSDNGNNAVKEILAVGGYTEVKTLVSVGGPGYFVLDGSGNVFLTSGGIIKLDYADAPSVIFPTPTPVGSKDTADGPQTFSVGNSGNQPLLFTTPTSGSNPEYPESFPENTTDTSLCAAGLSLAAGASCDVSLNFAPSVAGVNTGNVVLTDNALNGNPATQSISLEGISGVVAPVPVFTPNPGIYKYTQHVALSDSSSGAVIYYTLDGTMPTTSSTKYTAPIPVTWQSTINAIAVTTGTNPSPVVSGSYEIKRPVAPPTFSSPSGTYSAPFTFTLTPDPAIACSGGCELYYNINGDHGNGYLKYTGPVTITTPGTAMVKAFETAWHYTTSTVVSVTYVIQ